VHSALASQTAKQIAARVVGARPRDALYRLFYVAQSLITFGLVVGYGQTLPTRMLYQASGPLAVLLRIGQLVGLLHAFATAWQVGVARLLGLENVAAWVHGEKMPPGPIAQGPEMRADGHLNIRGPFLWSRHPLNFSPILVFWLTPRMTTRRLALNVVSTVYLVLGSWHEEARLRKAYGTAYAKYQSSGVPFYWPKRTNQKRPESTHGSKYRWQV